MCNIYKKKCLKQDQIKNQKNEKCESNTKDLE